MTAMQHFDNTSYPYHYPIPAPQCASEYRWAGGLLVDNFAGGGGASTGQWKAFGRSPDLAVNHDAEALAMHAENHPTTRHYNESVWDINIREATGGKPVLFGWFSPDCTHFSGARGGKPVKKNIRGLAWIVKKWAGQSDMAIFALENVTEFQTWGRLVAERCPKTGRCLKEVPELDENGKPKMVKGKKGTRPKMIKVPVAPGERLPVEQQLLVPDKKRTRRGNPVGKTFRMFVSQLRGMGYEIEWNDKMAAKDYGDPTIRKRLLMIGRKDGLPCNSQPVKTHCNPKLKSFDPTVHQPWETAGAHLDWSLDCPSLWAPGRRPLAEKTMARIAKGIQKFVIDAGDDAFIVKVNHTGYDQFRGQSLDEPLATITGTHATGVVDVQLAAVGMKFRGDSKGWTIHGPAPTITGGGACVRDAGAAHALGLMQVELKRAEFICTVDHQSSGDTSQGLDEPLSVVTSKQRHLRCAALLKNYTGVVGASMHQPAPTITATDHNSVVEATLAHVQRDFGNSVGHPLTEPLGAITAGGGGKSAVVTSSLVKLKGTCKHGQSLDEPLGTIGAQGNHYAEVRAFLMKYYATGAIGQGLDEPAHTIRAGDTFALVTIHGVDYQIVDIGMRMLQPHELYRCQGFPYDYKHAEVTINGKRKELSKASQTRMVGNSVPPGMAAAWCRANVPPWALYPLPTITPIAA